jgi:hypothetical protein
VTDAVAMIISLRLQQAYGRSGGDGRLSAAVVDRPIGASESSAHKNARTSSIVNWITSAWHRARYARDRGDFRGSLDNALALGSQIESSRPQMGQNAFVIGLAVIVAVVAVYSLFSLGRK